MDEEKLFILLIHSLLVSYVEGCIYIIPSVRAGLRNHVMKSGLRRWGIQY